MRNCKYFRIKFPQMLVCRRAMCNCHMQSEKILPKFVKLEGFFFHFDDACSKTY